MTETARMKWSRETGLPPNLFDAGKEELAWNIYLAVKTREEHLTERRLIMVSALKNPIMADALKCIDKMIDSDGDKIEKLTKEWERKQ